MAEITVEEKGEVEAKIFLYQRDSDLRKLTSRWSVEQLTHGIACLEDRERNERDLPDYKKRALPVMLAIRSERASEAMLRKIFKPHWTQWVCTAAAVISAGIAFWFLCR